MREIPMGSAEIKSLSSILRRVHFFADLSTPDLERVFEVTKLHVFDKRHEIVFKKGQPGIALYMIHKGAVDIVHTRLFLPNKKVARLEAGDFFGEMALLKAASRTATAITDGPTELFVLPSQEFLSICRHNPAFARMIKSVAEARAFESGNGGL